MLTSRKLPRSLLLLCVAAGAGCTPAPAGHDVKPATADTAPSVVMPGVPPAGNGAAEDADPLAGTWWVLAPSHPYSALRLGLVATPSPMRLEGSWVSFDWRSTLQSESLVRRSRPVQVQATRAEEPPAPGRLTITGPSPMLDENGQPNGQHGTWRLELEPGSLPGEELRFFGRAFHTELTGADGVNVELVRVFRPWKS